MCKKKGPKRDHFSRTKKEKGPFQQDKKEKKDFCVKKGPKKDHFSSLVLKRTKSLIKDLYASTAFGTLFDIVSPPQKTHEGGDSESFSRSRLGGQPVKPVSTKLNFGTFLEHYQAYSTAQV